MLRLQDGSAHDPFDTSCKFEEVDVDNVSLLTMSVQGKRYSMTPHEVSQMPLQSFSALWTVSPGNTLRMVTYIHATTGNRALPTDQLNKALLHRSTCSKVHAVRTSVQDLKCQHVIQDSWHPCT